MSDNHGQLLHLVFGGELKSLDSHEFRDIDKLDIVGIYPNYASARAPGAARRRQPLIMHICAISLFICTACSSLPRRAAPAGLRQAAEMADGVSEPAASPC